METRRFDIHKHFSMIIFGVSIVLITLISIVTYMHQDFTSANLFIFWIVKNHLMITIGIVIVSTMFGYLFSMLTYSKLQKTRKESFHLLNVLMRFLIHEEKEIVKHLLNQKGSSTQSEISKLPGMNRVKAYRSLQKMQEKNLIQITPHGKMRRISLNEDISAVLTIRA